jgi:hypothetical protein
LIPQLAIKQAARNHAPWPRHIRWATTESTVTVVTGGVQTPDRVRRSYY